MIIQVDTREKPSQLKRITEHFDNIQGVQWFMNKLDIGDYMSLGNPKFVIDRKQSLGEYSVNMGADHARFKREILRARDNGINLVFLIEDDQIKSIDDVVKWKNPNRFFHKRTMTGESLYKGMKTQMERYGVEFYFCSREETGYRIVELLKKNGG